MDEVIIASACRSAIGAFGGALKDVPPAFAPVYMRLISRRWPPVVALEGSACGGCHLTQPPAVSHTVRRNNSLVICQSCGRILYYA